MAQQNQILDLLEKTADGLKYVSGGFQAVPAPNKDWHKALTAGHRLFNVLGMLVGFVGAKELGDILVGHRLNGSKYEKIDKEDVLPPLRFLHGVLSYNPFSDNPKDQWLCVLHKSIPAIGGGIGAYFGSTFHFINNGTQQKINALQEMVKKGEKLSLADADVLATALQGQITRVIAACFGGFSSVSGLTPYGYGIPLNAAFSNANNSAGARDYGIPFLNKILQHVSKMEGNLAVSLKKVLDKTEAFCSKAKNGNVSEAASQYAKEVGSVLIAPLFRNISKADQEKIVAALKNKIEELYENNKGMPAAELQVKIQEGIDNVLKNSGTDLKLRIGDNGIFGKIAEFLDFGGKINAVRKAAGLEVPVQKLSNAAIAGIAGGIGAAGLGVAASLHKDKDPTLGKEPSPARSAGEYVRDIEQKHATEKRKGFIDGPVLEFAKKVSDMFLAVVPVHRFYSAVGLTIGGVVGLNIGQVVRGQQLDASAKEILKENVPKLLQPLYGLLKNGNNELANKWKGVAGAGIFAGFLGLGVAIGSKFAYASTEKKNRNPDSLEDYLARKRQADGNAMVAPVAGSAAFGSGAGLYWIPFVPLINYGASLAYRTVSMMDRNITLPGLNWLTGNDYTKHYFGVREGLDFLDKYAVNNPAKNPEKLEELSLTILSQIAKPAKIPLTEAHITKFVDKVTQIRDKYWQEGGVPQEKKKALSEEMKANFTGKGLYKTLHEDLGIDTKQINFHEVGGMIGKFANFFGAGKQVEKESKGYHALVDKWEKEDEKLPAPPLKEANEPMAKPEDIKRLEKTFTDGIELPRTPQDIINATLNNREEKILNIKKPSDSFEENVMESKNTLQLAAIGNR